MQLSHTEAVQRLTRRYGEQVRLFPTMARDVPLRLYLQRNLAAVRRGHLLKGYIQ